MLNACPDNIGATYKITNVKWWILEYTTAFVGCTIFPTKTQLTIKLGVINFKNLKIMIKTAFSEITYLREGGWRQQAH